MELADEVLQRIKDSISAIHTEGALKMCKDADFQIISIIGERGPSTMTCLNTGEDGKKASNRLKAREFIVLLDPGKGYCI